MVFYIVKYLSLLSDDICELKFSCFVFFLTNETTKTIMKIIMTSITTIKLPLVYVPE